MIIISIAVMIVSVVANVVVTALADYKGMMC